jgi:large subunit ribosomal protein L22
MTGPKTNEREGTRAVLMYCRLSPNKVRQVLDLIRGEHVERARDILRFSDRGAAVVVLKLLDSAIANAGNNDDVPEDELFVSACFADEGPTMRRFRPRARGRATRIRKRSCHVTIIVSRLPEEKLARHRQRRLAEETERRARRVAGGGRERRRVRSDARESAKGTEEVSEQTEDAVNVTPDTGETPGEEAGIVDQQEQAAAQVAEESNET